MLSRMTAPKIPSMRLMIRDFVRLPFWWRGETSAADLRGNTAPQALMRWGIHAVIAESFAEIFFGNCTALGIPAVCASRADLEKLAAAIQKDPRAPIAVDLLQKEIHLGEDRLPLKMPESARKALTTGQYDFLAQLLEGEPAIKQTAAALPYLNHFAS